MALVLYLTNVISISDPAHVKRGRICGYLPYRNYLMETTLFKKGFLFLALAFAISGKAQEMASDKIATDVVCGMSVNKAESYDWKYKGVKYYFDSFNCRETFKANPESFLLKKCAPKSNFIDPVCGIKLEISESYDLKYGGKVYHFHTLGCKEAFKMNPDKFLKNYCAPKDSIN